MDFRSIQWSKKFFSEGKEDNARLCYTNTGRPGEEDEDASFDDWSSSLKIARKMLQISEKWAQQISQLSGNSSEKQGYFTIKQKFNFHFEVATWILKNERIWRSKSSKLESCGFYRSHCVQALIYTDGDLEDALETLFYKYYNIKDIIKIEDSEIPNADELLKIRQGEKQKLETIFCNNFYEKIENRVWVLQLELRYLRSSPSVTGDSQFTLEIRFPKECTYPYEPPYIYFYKNNGKFPRINCLRIARRLHDEALLYSLEGIPSIYSVISLLKDESKIQVYLEENREPFLQPFESLYERRPEEREKEDEDMRGSEMRDMMEQEKECIVNYCKPSYVKKQMKEEELYCDLLELRTKEQERNVKEEEKSTITPYIHVPLFARGREKREESMINPLVLELSHAGGPEKREENMVDPNVLVPSYAGKPEKREGNIFNPYEVEPLYAEEPEEREGSIVKHNIFEIWKIWGPRERETFDPHKDESLYVGGPEEQEGSIFNSNMLELWKIWGPEMRERNIFDTDVLVPLYPPGKREESIVNSHVLEPSYEGRPEIQERNIVDEIKRQYAGVVDRTEGSIFDPDTLVAVYAEKLKEQEEESIVNPHEPEPSYIWETEERERNMVNTKVLIPSYAEKPYLTLSDIYYFITFEKNNTSGIREERF